MFVWNYKGDLYVFLNISIIIADINSVRTKLCSEITLFHSDLFFMSLFFFFLPKKDVTFCEKTDTAHSYIEHIVKF